jgi:coenzyme F420-reducing hydrogenase alpha subunit
MHGTDTSAPVPTSRDRDVAVRGITRVEGEGSLRLRVRNGVVEEAHLEIFEAPRYFERLVVGRTPDEVIDIVARICGICPVAYQMTAVRAFEDAFGVEIDPEVRRLRRLMYCGEWLQSHALHVYLLHAPDFLGYASAIDLATDHRSVVEQGLAIKRVGNEILEALGGRAIHPLTVRVGGFSHVPSRADLAALRPALVDALTGAEATLALVRDVPAPDYRREMPLLALRHATDYPMNEGRIVSSTGLDLDQRAWDSAFHEEQVPWSHALQARDADGRAYLLGPAARLALAGSTLHPRAAEALASTGLAGAIGHNPFLSIVGRAVELIHVCAEALDIVDAYRPPVAPSVAWTSRPGIAAWSTEAPRGLLFHRYEIDDRGRVATARIVPPTSQNQAAIESDLARYAAGILDLPQAEMTHRLEQLIRSYDPCISCATYFLDLEVDDR